MEHEVSPKERFVPSILPWLIAAAGLLIYLLTLNHWVSIGSLATVSRLAGINWLPDISGPLYWLVTYPFRWLPGPLMPLALNVFAAICGAATLGLLARSVALLPHDRTHEQREREHSPAGLLSIPNSWLPPVLAVLVCGLQLSFWEYSTSAAVAQPLFASGEIFDLLLFSYVIRCVLEYRVDGRESWLTRASFVYALGMTNNWAMVGFFPLFLGALLWIRGVSFFESRFLTRMFFAGALGLSLYLLLPVVQSLANYGQLSFWEGLKSTLGAQKVELLTMAKGARKLLLLLSLTSIVPLILIGIKWSSFSGDVSRAGTGITKAMFQVIHGLFLFACVWVSFDPPFSPRNQGGGIPFLTFYYLGALCVGYFSGFFLLMAEGKINRWRKPPAFMKLISQAMAFIVWCLLLLVPFIQVYKNLPQIKITNGPMFERFGQSLARSLPEANALILSDDGRRLALAELAAIRAGKARSNIFVDTRALVAPDYHRYLKTRYPDQWPIEIPKGFDQSPQPAQLLNLITSLGATHAVYYLNPSFGYYFESFYQEPQGLSYKLIPYPSDSFLPPPLSTNLLASNSAFWKEVEAESLSPLLHALQPPPSKLDRTFSEFRLVKEENMGAMLLAQLYSPVVNYWACELQKAGDLTNAFTYFELARKLSPYNVVARLNMDCNQSLRAGTQPAAKLSKELDDEFMRYRDWDQLIILNGPFDHPTYTYEQGRTLIRGNNHRQAAQQFSRAKQLAPDNARARLWLAEILLSQRWPDEALKEISELKTSPDFAKSAATNLSEVLLIEASAWLAKQNPEKAAEVVQSALARSPANPVMLETASQVYMNSGLYSNALPLIQRQLALTPDSTNALMSMGIACLQLKEYEKAIPPLNKLLSFDTNNHAAVLNRAIACLQTEQLDQAQRDYETLATVYTNAFQVYFGLGEIAYRKKDKPAAIRYYELYLSKDPPVAEAQRISERLKELNAPGPP